MSDRMMTPEDAKARICPRGMGGDYRPGCVATSCMAWRWEPLTCSPQWVEAVKRKAAETGEDHKTLPKAKAARYVAENPKEFGLPDKPFRGYCGLAGKPEA